VRLPDPRCSYALLIGTSTYRSGELADLLTVRNNLDGLFQVLTDPGLGGLPADRCIVLVDPTDVRMVYRTLRQYATLATDTLLVYFAGHGHTDLRNELYLSLTDTNPDELRITALPFDLIREVLSDSPATNRVLILDCCFSGRAIPDLSSHDEAILGQVGIEGTYTLTATPATAVALAPTGATYTAFTGELLTLLRTGIPDGPELLTFATIYRRLLHALTTRGLPRPGQRGTGTVDQLALTRNSARSAKRPSTASTTGFATSHIPPGTIDDNGVEFRKSGGRVARAVFLPQLGIAFLICGWIGMAVLNPSLLDKTNNSWFFWVPTALIPVYVFMIIGFIVAGSKGGLVVDSTGITVRDGSGKSIHYPWNEFLSVEMRRDPPWLSLVGVPRINSALLGDKEFKKEWDKRGYLTIAAVNLLRCSPSTLSRTLVHYSRGVYRSEDPTLL